MTITSNIKPSANTVEVKFNIDAAEFENAVQAVYLKQRKHITIQGFRKGKASRQVIEKTHGAGAFYNDAVEKVYKDNWPKLIDELGLGTDLIDYPDVEVEEIDKENGVSFKALLTVKPEVAIGTYMGLEVEVPQSQVTDKDVDDELELILAENARIIDSSDTPVENGDIVKIDFSGFCDGEPFDGGVATNLELEVGSGRFIPGFEEQLVGKMVGEDFDVNVVFPDEYFVESLKSKPALFKCKINEKSSKELTELDDEFVKDISEFDTLDEFKEDVRRLLAEAKEDENNVELERAVTDKLAEIVEAEIPEIMIASRCENLAQDYALNFGMKPEEAAKQAGKTYEGYLEGFREVAIVHVKIRLGLEKIAAIENLEVSEEEIDAHIEKMSKENRMSVEKINEIVARDGIVSDLKCEKALDLIKTSAKITYVTPDTEAETV